MTNFFGVDGELYVSSVLSSYMKTLDYFNREDFSEGELETAKMYFGYYPSIPLLEKLLSFYKAEKEKVLVDDIPSFLAENGLSSCTFPDGRNISLDKFYSVKVNDQEKLIEYLKSTKADGIIKIEVVFEAGEDQGTIRNALDDKGFSYKCESIIHPMSLKALFRHIIEDGEKLPNKDVCEVKVFTKAKIK